MAISWDMFIRRDKSSLLSAGIISLAVAVVFLFMYFDKEKIKSSSDITLVSGPFDEYNWINFGLRNGSSLIFKLRNYSNKFKVKADFFSILKKDKFKAIHYGDTLTVGIPNHLTKDLDKPNESLFVYSISSRTVDYLNFGDAIKKHNSPLLLFTAGAFVIAGYVFIHLARKAKAEIYFNRM